MQVLPRALQYLETQFYVRAATLLNWEGTFGDQSSHSFPRRPQAYLYVFEHKVALN